MFTCGQVEGHEPLWVFNPFFMSMRAKFTAAAASLRWFDVEWDASATGISWAAFRAEVRSRRATMESRDLQPRIRATSLRAL